MPKDFEYQGCRVVRERVEKPLLIGVNDGTNKYRKEFWRVIFPDNSWSCAGTKSIAKDYIDRNIGNHGRTLGVQYNKEPIFNEVNDSQNKNRLRVLREGGSIVKFRELPEAAQLALVHYMALDGEAWDYLPEFNTTLPDPSGKALRDALPYYVKKYGNYLIGYHPGIATHLLTTAVMGDRDIEYNHWDEYHAWYKSKQGHEKHDISKPLWPVILSSIEDDHEETLQDGWHRFHDYVSQGVEKIPALYYFKQEHQDV